MYNYFLNYKRADKLYIFHQDHKLNNYKPNIYLTLNKTHNCNLCIYLLILKTESNLMLNKCQIVAQNLVYKWCTMKNLWHFLQILGSFEAGKLHQWVQNWKRIQSIIQLEGHIHDSCIYLGRSIDYKHSTPLSIIRKMALSFCLCCC